MVPGKPEGRKAKGTPEVPQGESLEAVPAALYVRTPEGDPDNSLEVQLTALRRYARRRQPDAVDEVKTNRTGKYPLGARGRQAPAPGSAARPVNAPGKRCPTTGQWNA